LPLVYTEAEKIWKMISCDLKLAELERSGFVKYIARKTCLNDVSRVRILWESLIKQFKDFEEASYEDQLEALADIRNVAGLLFLALKGA
jgi:hypothetical protein